MPAGLSSTGPIHRLHVQDLNPNRHISKLLFHAFVISLPINLCHTNFIKEGGDAVLRKHTSLLEHVLPVHLKHCEEKSRWHVRKDFIIRLQKSQANLLCSDFQETNFYWFCHKMSFCQNLSHCLQRKIVLINFLAL